MLRSSVMFNTQLIYTKCETSFTNSIGSFIKIFLAGSDLKFFKKSRLIGSGLKLIGSGLEINCLGSGRVQN